ncbi:MAG: thiamine-phosphate kinase [Rikenellaceae bacterium]|nr:thiamine-phosphate kinase [Rikenellaceae bacterium]
MGEFDFIEAIKTSFEGIGDTTIEGIGDDCAIIPISGEQSLVITTDMLIEDVHFLRQSCTPEELGYKSLAVNLSDVASMGVRPIATLLSISLPQECTGEWAQRFMEGYRALSEQYGVALIGGDTTASKSGIAINVTAIGQGANANIKRRCAAQEGDIIAVSGQLGISTQGLRDILNSNTTSDAAILHKRPTPRINEGAWLGTHCEVHAMMDLSDGLASDLCHILRASEVAAEIEVERIPAPYGVENAVCGGEDYELLMTISAEAFESIRKEFVDKFSTPLTAVGRIVRAETGTIAWYENGVPITPSWRGFTHF